MADLPYMPWFPADLAASPDYQAMTALERLAYRELLDACWLRGGRLPSDAGYMQRLTKGRVTAAVLAKFIPHPDGGEGLTNARLWEEWCKASLAIDATSRQRKAAARARWDKKNGDAGAMRPHSDRNAGGVRAQCYSESEPDTIPPLSPKGDISPLGRGTRFMPPTIDEVKAYCFERKNAVDAETWHAHYTANGWRVGKNPMKDWRAAVRTWERGSISHGNQPRRDSYRSNGRDFDAEARANMERKNGRTTEGTEEAGR